MKILHLITVNAIGGAEKLMPVFLSAQQKAGYEVNCLLLYQESYSTDPANETAKQLEAHGIRHFIVSCTSITDKVAREKIAEIINSNHYDLVHSHLKYADFFLSQLKWKRKITVPVVSTMHGYRDIYQNKHGLNVKFQLYFSPYYWITRFIFNKLDGFVFISTCMKSFYTRAGLLRKNQNAIIYHGYPGGPKLYMMKFLSTAMSRRQSAFRAGLLK
jgi:glycosyltransferase involved in cell wall biosynthesis